MKILILHGAVLAGLFAAQFLLPVYHANALARIMVLSVYAMGYNIAFGSAGLLSLGHGLFFAMGMYGAGLAVWQVEWTTIPALTMGMVAGGVTAAVVAMLVVQATRITFMIAPLILAQAGYLLVLYFDSYTGGHQGFAVEAIGRRIFGTDLAQNTPRFLAAFALFAVALVGNLVLARSRFGQAMRQVREEKAQGDSFGHDRFTVKAAALVISGLYAGAAGAFYAVLFGYVGAEFAAVQYSILPLLSVMLGGAGTVLGPLLGVGLTFYVIGLKSLIAMVVTLAVVGLLLPKGLLGSLRDRWLRWLP